MKLYKEKNVEVYECRQAPTTGDALVHEAHDIFRWLLDARDSHKFRGIAHSGDSGTPHLWVHPLGQVHNRILPGQWILKARNGFIIVKDDIDFKEEYVEHIATSDERYQSLTQSQLST